VFLLNHKDSIDFNKGLERIEITIENIIEADESQKSQSSSKQETDKGFTKNTNQNKIVNDELNSISFIFDETKRRWIKSIDKTHRA
jgi:hypothetical protein